MNIDLERRGAIVVANVAGDFDATSLPGFLSKVDPMLEAGDVRFILDLSGVLTITSTALGAMVDMSKRAREAGGEVVVARPSAFVARVLNTLGVGIALRSFPSVESALGHFGPDGRARARRR